MMQGEETTVFDSAAIVRDASSVAPERDHFSEAPEVDWTRNAPELVPHQGLHVNYGEQPSLNTYIDGEEKECTATPPRNIDTTRSPSSRHKVYRWPWATAIVLLALLVLGLGIGLGVGLRKSLPGHAAPSTSSQIPKILHAIRNDSSIAAVGTPDGSRYVFFQHMNGSLCQAQFSPTTKTWASSSNTMIPNTADARVNTPMTATVFTESLGGDEFVSILLLYTSRNNRIAAVSFDYQNDRNWGNASTFYNISQYTTASNSRSLAIAQVPSTNGSSELLILFEDSSGRPTSLHGGHAKTLPPFNRTTSEPFWSWNDTTATITANKSDSNAVVSAPFAIASGAEYPNGLSKPEAAFFRLSSLFFLADAAPGASLLNADFINGSWVIEPIPDISDPTSNVVGDNSAVGDNSIPQALKNLTADESAVKASDWVVVEAVTGQVYNKSLLMRNLLWVNGTTLSYYGNSGDAPEWVKTSPATPFPYTRLAFMRTVTPQAYYLYHQTTATEIVEELWDPTVSSWSSTTISISSS